MKTYNTPIGILPSVTTILKATESQEDKDRLRKWQHKQDKLHGLEQSTINNENYKNRGTEIHEAIKYKFHHNVEPAEVWRYKGNSKRWKHLQPFLKSITIIECEKELWHQSGYAGTADLICVLGNQLTLLDWKTSDRIKKRQWLEEAFIQTAAYTIAWNDSEENAEQEFLANITQLAVIVISPEKLQIFTENDLEKYQNLWLERLAQFKKMQDNKN